MVIILMALSPMGMATILLTVTPVAELRGGIPLGISFGFDPRWLVPLCIFVNSLIYPPYRLLLDKGLSRVGFIEKQVERVRARGQKYINRWGFWGLVIFVGVPLPFSGVYSGTLVSWIFNLDFKKAYLAMLLGCAIAGSIVAVIVLYTGFTLPRLLG